MSFKERTKASVPPADPVSRPFPVRGKEGGRGPLCFGGYCHSLLEVVAVAWLPDTSARQLSSHRPNIRGSAEGQVAWWSGRTEAGLHKNRDLPFYLPGWGRWEQVWGKEGMGGDKGGVTGWKAGHCCATEEVTMSMKSCLVEVKGREGGGHDCFPPGPTLLPAIPCPALPSLP